jgi:hypothetical protein
MNCIYVREVIGSNAKQFVTDETQRRVVTDARSTPLSSYTEQSVS